MSASILLLASYSCPRTLSLCVHCRQSCGPLFHTNSAIHPSLSLLAGLCCSSVDFSVRWPLAGCIFLLLVRALYQVYKKENEEEVHCSGPCGLCSQSFSNSQKGTSGSFTRILFYHGPWCSGQHSTIQSTMTFAPKATLKPLSGTAGPSKDEGE